MTDPETGLFHSRCIGWRYNQACCFSDGQRRSANSLSAKPCFATQF